jgi:hypothetical protein
MSLVGLNCLTFSVCSFGRRVENFRLSGNNSIISLFSGSSDMVATSVGLFFNFATPGAAVFFGGTDAAHFDFVLAYPYVNYPTGIEWSYGGSATQLTQVMI